MIVLGCDEWVNEFISRQGGGKCFPGSYRCVGWEYGNELVGGIAVYNANRFNAFVNIAVTRKSSVKGLLCAGLRYCFGQLQLSRLTFVISSGNLPSIQFVTGLGATREASLHGAGEGGEDMFIYTLRPETCPIWSKISWQKAAVPHPLPLTTQV